MFRVELDGDKGGSFMPYTEQQIDQIFAQLGIGKAGYLSGNRSQGGFLSQDKAEGGFLRTDSKSTVPSQFRHHLDTDPAALDQHGFWQHFWWGVTSPVTGTAHKIAPDKFPQWDRPEPHNTSTMIGKMAGSFLGWTGVTVGLTASVLAAPITVTASGIAALGVGTKLATGIATGAVTGALMGAHQGWLDDGDIPVETLKGMAFGAGMAGLGYGVGKAAMKLGITQPKAYDLMKQEFLKKNPMLLMNDPTDEAIHTIMNVNRVRQGAIDSAIARSARATAIDISDDVFRSLSSKQKNLVNQIKGAKTIGEQYDLITKLERSAEDGFNAFMKDKKVTSLWELVEDGASHSTIRKYQGRFEAVENLKSIRKDYVSRLMGGDVELPRLEAITDIKASKALWDSLKTDIKTSGIKKDDHFWHPDLDAVFAKYSGKDGLGYSTTNRNFWPEALKKEFSQVSKQLKSRGEPLKLYNWGNTMFPVPDNIPTSKLAGWIDKQTKFPEIPGYAPVSVAETWATSRGINWFSRNFFPLRYGLGKSTADKLRVATQQHQSYYDKTAATPIRDWMKDLGVSGGKEAKRQGEIIGRRGLELDFDTQVNQKFNRAGTLLKRGIDAGTEMDERSLAVMAKSLGVAKPDLKSARTHYLSRAATSNHGPKGNLSFDEYLSRMGTTPEEYIGTWLKQYKLYRAAPRATDAVAKGMGFENAKQLKVAYQMRRSFDKLFKEAGFDPIDYQVGYMPRFRSNDGRGYEHLLKSFKQIGMTEKQASKILWMNQMHREVPNAAYTYETDAFKTYARYVSGYSKFKHYDDVFENINKAMKGSKVSESRIELWNKVQAHLKGVPTQMEQDMDRMIKGFGDALGWKGWNEAWGPKPTREMMSVLAELQVMGGLGFNPFTAVKNMTQKILAFSSITDDGNPLRGMYYMAKASAFKRTAEGKRFVAMNKIRHDRMFHESFGVIDDSMSAVARRMGVADPLLDAGASVRKKAMWMFKTSDMGNVDDTFLAKLLYMREQGANLATAVNVAQQTTMATQFMYGFDSPMLYKSTGPLGPVGRAVGVFTSWPLNWAHLMYTQGTAGEAQRALASVVSMAVASEVLSLTKFSFNSIHPAETAKGILPIAAMEGEQGLPMLLRSAATAAGAYRAFKEGDFATVDQAISNFKNRMWLLVPAGTMAKRTWEIIDIAQAEWRKTQETGQPMFAQGMDTPIDILDANDRLRYTSKLSTQLKGWFGPTLEQQMMFEDWRRVSEIDYAYRYMRKQAIESFMVGDFDKFQYLQEQMVINFGKWIEPKDIKNELELRGESARVRQMKPLPESIREPLFERLQMRQVERLGYMIDKTAM